jgi:hypothetical protein
MFAWHNGDITDVFIGVMQVGLIPAYQTGSFNTFVGSGAGFNNSVAGAVANGCGSPGYENSFYGYQAGFNNACGWRNTASGLNAL